MAENNLDIVIKAHDDYTSTFKRFETTATHATNTAATNAAGSAGTMDRAWSGALGNVQAAWIKLGVVVAASAWFVAAGQKALEAEVAYNKLRIQVEALGLSYEAQKEHIEGAINAAAKYAIVQDEDVAAVLQQLILHSGNYAGSLENLNLVYDLAYLKGIDAAEAATLVGKAMGGNTEGLGRLFPELKNVNDLLGENATRSEKAAYNLQFLNEKVAGSNAQMIETEVAVKRANAAYEMFHQVVGGLVNAVVVDLFGKLRDTVDALSDLKTSIVDVYDAINGDTVATTKNTNAYKAGNDAIMELVFARGKSLAAIEKETKAKSDLREANDKAAKQTVKDEQSAAAKIIDMNLASERLVASKEQLIEIESRAFRSQGASTAQVIQYIDALKKKQLAEAEVEARKGLKTDEEEAMRLQQKIDLAILKDMNDEEHLFKAELRMQKRNEFMGMEVTNQQAYDELSAQSTQARAAIVSSAYAAMEDQMLSLIETGHFSVGQFAKIVAQQVKIELVGLAARAAIWAIFELAMGLANTAAGNFASAALNYSSAFVFGTIAVGALAAAAGVQALVGSSSEGSTAGSSAVASRREASTSGGGGLAAPSTRTQEKQTQNVTIIINNPLSDQNWDRIAQDNIIPAINAAGERNVKISLRAVEAY